MMKAALASASVLALVGCLSVSDGQVGFTKASAQEMMPETTGALGPAGPAVTEAKIARLKRALRLRAEQEVHWHPVENTLRRIALAAKRESKTGIVQRVRAKVAGYADTASAYQQVSSVAGPLIATLDERQKQEGMRLIREFGFSGQ